MMISSDPCSLDVTNEGKLVFSQDARHLWSTDGPLFILHYYDRQHPRAQAVTVPSGMGHAYGTAGTPSLGAKAVLSIQSKSPTELEAAADFQNIHIRVVLNIELASEGLGFSIRIEEGAVEEKMPSLYRILGIELLPGFGAARTGEEGYLTLPNWSGCQTFFDKSYPREVRQTIYSSNDQWEYACNMPVFGITRGQGTLCGLVAKGDFDAQLVCRVHWEQEHANSIHPHLIYRWQQQDDLLQGCREVRYAFAPADYDGGEGYVFCGKVHRDFLRGERGLLSWDEKAQTRPVVLDYRDRFFLKIFMAYKDPQADGHGPYHSTCTFAEAREILEQCLARGMKKLAVMLVGWGQDGHDGMPPKRFPVDERLGGEPEFKKLIAWCKDRDILLGVHDSYGEAYSCSPEFDLKDIIRHRSGEPWQGVIWSGGQVHKICPSVFVEKHTRRDVPAIKALGLYGHHHIDAVGSFVTCYSKEHPLEKRADFIGQVRKMFQFTVEQMGSVSTEMPFGPYFDVVDGYFHTQTKPSAWHRASPIGQFFLDRTIPLLPIVLHGSINCCECARHLETDPVNAIDWGLSLQWEVCKRPSPSFSIPAYEQVAETMARLYQQHYAGLLQKLNPLTIEGRWELADGVTRTRYSDGTAVVVNSTNAPHSGLPPMSYKVENAVP